MKLEGVRTEMSSQNETEEKEVGEVNGSRGRRKGRGVIPFFAHVQKLGKVDRLIQADIVGYFININIHIFISTLNAHIGQGNDAFCNLIEASDIKDQNRKSYAFIFKGIQRVSPLSPVLLNIFLQKHIMLIHILS